LPQRARALAIALIIATSFVLGAVPGAAPEPAAAASPKVAIIVGPVGSLTSSYRSWANDVAAAATSAGATVAKAYSPSATWGNVLKAVAGANVIVYFGHGNGYPNPYSSGTEWTDRVNGWGLNTKTTNGDADSWSAGTLVYCGEKALLGTLTSSDGAAQRTYCSGGPIKPAPGFTMVYAQAHYAPGFGERYVESDPIPTLSQAQQRVKNYSYPMLKLGASGYIATAYGDAKEIVARVLAQPGRSFGELFKAGRGYKASALKTTSHADIAGAEVWVQKTTISSFHFGDPDYWYAFAGKPTATPGSAGSSSGLPFSDIASSVFVDEIVWLADTGITRGCTSTLFCPKDYVSRGEMASFLARALDLPAASRDWFSDDTGLSHEDNINRIAEAGITIGCSATEFCPHESVSRGQMASFLARGLELPQATKDWFTDDRGTAHEDAINRIADAGITIGCTDTRFCPSGLVKRQQIAAFLFRAMGS
jgi:S-layer homology domain